MKRENEDDNAVDPAVVSTKPKIESSLDLENLGAGYNIEDNRIIKAVQFYESELLPFVKKHTKIFKRSNFISIKGYGADLKVQEFTSHRSSPTENPYDRPGSPYDRPEKGYRIKRPRHSL